MKDYATQEQLKNLFTYNPDTGELIRKISSGGFKKGSVAGSLTKYGYLCVRVNYRLYQIHRLIWVYVHGYFPNKDIDHINRVRTDNRLENLREATRSQNLRNKEKSNKNISGYKGVSFFARDKKWMASIQINGKKKYLGYFDTPLSAHEAYKNFAEKHFGEFSHA